MSRPIATDRGSLSGYCRDRSRPVAAMLGQLWPTQAAAAHALLLQVVEAAG